MRQFKAFWVEEKENGQFERKIIERSTDDLPKNDCLIAVHYSSLNYKDALSITGNKGITKKYPHQPGIDAAGTVIASKAKQFKPGDDVIVTGYDLGMNTDGGLGQCICVPHQWVVPKPPELSLFDAMRFGTAGFTAALGLSLLERNGQKPEDGPVIVTGATGGVGSCAVGILHQAGYEVIAATGKWQKKQDYLRQLGATSIVPREDIAEENAKALMKSQWAGGIDTVGGMTLVNLLKACKPYGNIACCGLVQSPNIPMTVYPFIINGISLLGMASAENPIAVKKHLWQKLATSWYFEKIKEITEVISLNQVSSAVDQMLQGQIIGRRVVDLSLD